MSYKKTLISNFLSLSSVQVANYILPLFTVPYLVRILGPEKFGLIAFAQAFIGYFSLITDYGFNLSATREIAINRNNKERIAEIFNSVMIIKTGFLLISFFILCLFVFNIDKFKIEWKIYLATFGMVAGNVFFPVWFFQGMEKMKQVALLNMLAKLFFTVSIFVFIRTQSDYFYLPLINSAGFIVVGLLSLFMIFKEFGIFLHIPTFDSIKFHLIQGWHIFLSTIAINLYTGSNIFILGLFTSNTIVGYYSAGEKIIKAAQGMLSPLSQTIYPHISKLANESRDSAMAFIRRLTGMIGWPMFVLSLVLCVFAAPISNLILGKQFKESIPVIRILAFVPFIISMATVYANFFLLAFGYVKAWSRIIMFSSGMSLLGAMIFVYMLRMGHIGVSINVLLTEIIVLASSFLAYHKYAVPAPLQ